MTASGVPEGKEVPVRHPDVTEKKVHEYSSRFLDALAVKGKLGTSDNTQPEACGEGTADDGIYLISHYWQIDNVPAEKHEAAVQRLRTYLESQGWETTFRRTGKGSDKWPELDAENPKDGYTLLVRGILENSRIGVEVYSPCSKTPEGVDSPLY